MILNKSMAMILPIVSLYAGIGLKYIFPFNDKQLCGFHHFTAGIIFAAVAFELIPSLSHFEHRQSIIVGFILGVLLMLAIKEYHQEGALVGAIAIDLCIDGLLVAIGFVFGAQGGMVLLFGLVLETLSLGVSTSCLLTDRYGYGVSGCLKVSAGLSTAMIAGYAIGWFSAMQLSSTYLAGLIGFGISSLLYIVTEELLVEAHKLEDTPLATAMFFVGFCIPLIFSL